VAANKELFLFPERSRRIRTIPAIRYNLIVFKEKTIRVSTIAIGLEVFKFPTFFVFPTKEESQLGSNSMRFLLRGNNKKIIKERQCENKYPVGNYSSKQN
jgi:hypothetical protein